jgi:hypothetical protein
MREATMGFMDKAKKLAEQAQQKLDEAQKNFNKGGSTPGQPGAAGGGPTYDEHGRAVQEEEPAPDPAAPEPASEQPTEGLGPNATPDPFKPPQQ